MEEIFNRLSTRLNKLEKLQNINKSSIEDNIYERIKAVRSIYLEINRNFDIFAKVKINNKILYNSCRKIPYLFSELKNYNHSNSILCQKTICKTVTKYINLIVIYHGAMNNLFSIKIKNHIISYII